MNKRQKKKRLKKQNFKFNKRLGVWLKYADMGVWIGCDPAYGKDRTVSYSYKQANPPIWIGAGYLVTKVEIHE